MILVSHELRPVYRGRTRDLLTRRAACQQFAWLRWNESRPNPNGVLAAFCDCDPSTGYSCDCCTPDVFAALNQYSEYSSKVVARYAARLCRTRDLRIAERLRDVWRAPGRRGRLRAKTAYLDAAWDAYRARHGCGETVEEHGFHNYPHRCDSRCFGEDPTRTVERLARWLAWRDGVAIRTRTDHLEMKRPGDVGASPVMADTFSRKGRHGHA